MHFTKRKLTSLNSLSCTSFDISYLTSLLHEIAKTPWKYGMILFPTFDILPNASFPQNICLVPVWWIWYVNFVIVDPKVTLRWLQQHSTWASVLPFVMIALCNQPTSFCFALHLPCLNVLNQNSLTLKKRSSKNRNTAEIHLNAEFPCKVWA